MASRRVAHDPDRGGEVVQAPRANRARVASAVAAFAIAGGLVAAPAAVDATWRPLLLLVGGCALAALVAAVVLPSRDSVGWAVLLLGAEAMIHFGVHGPVDPWAPLFAAGLLAVAELSYWSISRRLPVVEEPDVALSRAGTLVGLCAGGAVVSGLVVVAAGSGARGGVALEAVGVAAAIALVGLLAALARR